MKYTIYRKSKETDLAVGVDDKKVYVRRGKISQPLKKATVYPFSSTQEAKAFANSMQKTLCNEGYTAITQQVTTEDAPYPRCVTDGKLHWSCVYDEPNRDAKEMRRMLIKQLADIAIIVAEHEALSVHQDEKNTKVIICDNGVEFTFGFDEDSTVAFSTNKATGGEICSDYNCAFVAMLLKLSINEYGFVIKISNDAQQTLTTEIEETLKYVPVVDKDRFLRLCEALELCVAPVSWGHIRNNKQSNTAIWQF